MESFEDRVTIKMSSKTRAAMTTFLKKYGAENQEVSHFIEEAITWYILERQKAIRQFLASTANGEEYAPEQHEEDDSGRLTA